jgi:hypothetical protein
MTKVFVIKSKLGAETTMADKRDLPASAASGCLPAC